MEFRQLECFLAVAVNGNVTKAAEVLHISQPAVTKAVRLLEADLGTELFARVGKRIALNDAGKAVLEDAKEILERQRIIYHKAQTFGMAPNPELTLIVTAASELLPGLIGAFCEKYPEIRLQVVRRFPGPEDVGVLISSAIRGCDGATHHTVYSEELAVAVPKGHPLAGNDSISLRELANHPILSMTGDNDIRRLEEHLAEEADVAFRHMIECDNPALLRALLREGLAPAIVPARTWPSIHCDGVLLRPIRNQTCMRYLNAQIIHPERGDENVRLLFEFVEAYFGALAAGG